MGRKFFIISLFVLFLLTIPVQANSNSIPQFASTGGYRVTTTLDSNDEVCDSHCSLREAIIAANNSTALNPIVYIPNGIYTLTLTGADEDAAATGDLDITRPMNIIGEGRDSTIIDANGIDRVFDVHGTGLTSQYESGYTDYYSGGWDSYWHDAQFLLSNVTVQNGYVTAADGGGMRIASTGLSVPHVVLMDIVIQNSIAANGGGLAVKHVHLHSYHLRLLSNIAENRGGGLFFDDSEQGSQVTAFYWTFIQSNIAALGGGAYLLGESGSISGGYGQSGLMQTALVGNTAQDGGGIYFTGSSHEFYLTGTVSGNRANNNGGGIYNDNTIINIYDATITNNTADFGNDGSGDGGGIYNYGSSTAISTSILYGNIDTGEEAAECDASDIPPYIDASLHIDNSILGIPSPCTVNGFNLLSQDPLLQPLANNGGDMLTHALLANSPAIGWLATCSSETDQRGVPRSAPCEPGAYAYTDGVAFAAVPPIPYIAAFGIFQGSTYPPGEIVNNAGRELPLHIFTYEPLFNVPDSTTHPAESDNPANYRLLLPGADNIFQTNSCPSVLNDDINIPVQVTIDNKSNSQDANRQFVSLMPADDKWFFYNDYRLIICDEITDLDSNALDGNMDGVPGGDAYFDIDFAYQSSPSELLVTTTEDVTDGICNDHCSLRDAVRVANSTSSATTIFVPAGTYNLSLVGADEDFALTGDLDIGAFSSITIVGADSAATIIDGQGADRIFHAYEASIRLVNLTLRNGVAGEGSAVRTSTSVELINTNILNNSSDTDGAVFAYAIYSYNSTFSGNNATLRGSAISGSDIQLYNSTVSGNGGTGGAIFSASYLRIYSTTIANNESGVLYAGNISQMDVFSTIFANNDGVNCGIYPNYPANPALTVSGRFNILDDNSCAFGARNLYNTDALLLPLSYNGGATQTHALAANSPARNILRYPECDTLFDQHGTPRNTDGLCNIGAFEGESDSDAPIVTVTSTTPTTVTLDWYDVPTATGYAIELYDTTLATWVSAGTTSSSITTKTYAGLFCGTTYQYRVRASYAASTFSDYSATVAATTSACSQPPTAQFIYNCLGLACSFNGTLSTDSNGTITRYSWNFGDGATSTSTVRGHVGHVFAAPGTYAIALTVQDDWGITHTVNQDVTLTTTTETAFTVNSTADTYDGICNVTNCTIRDAIDAAQWLPDGQVYIPAGNYTIESELVIKGGLAIRGAGRTNTILTGYAMGDMFTTSVAGNPVPLTLMDLSLDTGRRAIDDRNDLSSLTLLRTNFSHFDDMVAIYEMGSVDDFVLLIEQSSFVDNISHYGLFEMSTPASNSAMIIRDSYIADNDGDSVVATGVLTINTAEFYLLIENTTFARNIQNEGRRMIDVYGVSPRRFEINNSTFLQNGSTIYSNAYLFDVAGSQLLWDMYYLTFAGNVSPIRLRPSGEMLLNMSASIIENNGEDLFTDCNGQYINAISGGANLFDYYTSCFGMDGVFVPPGEMGLDQIVVSSTNYLTEYVTLTADSPAFDAILAEDCGGGIDQRGVSRPQGLGCDIGAVEMESVSMPTNLAIAGTTDTSISLSWTDTTDESSYRIERSSDSGANWSEVGTTAVNATVFTDNTVACNTAYQYRVQATDGTNFSAYSNTVSDSTDACLQTGPVFTVITDSGTPGAGCRVDYCSLEAAMEVATADEGESIVLPAGNYDVPVYISQSVHIIGAGAGQTIFNGHGSSILFTVADGAPADISLTLDGVTLQGGYADGGTAVFPDPEGIFGSITVRNSYIVYNVGESTIYGGYINNDAVLTFENVIISHNVSERYGLITMSGPASPTRKLFIRDAVISENTATNAFGIGFLSISAADFELVIEKSAFAGNGTDTGGSLLEISGASNTPIQISNSTFSANTSYPTRASVADISGAVNLVMMHNTITQNTESAEVFNYNPGSTRSMTVFGNIFAGNEGEDFGCRNVISQGYNIFGNMGCTYTPHATDTQTTEPLLAGYAEYQGTIVYAPQSGSPALDAIPVGSCMLTTDQAGISRPQGSGCDIGAFEVDGDFLPAPTNLTVTNTTTTSITLSWTDTVNETGYRIERQLNVGSPWIETGTTAANVNTFTNSDLTCGTTYHYRVRAADGAVLSEYSEPINAETSPCPIIFTVTTTQDTNDGVCNTHCSLREAIIAANNAAGSPIINIPAGTYTLTLTGVSEDNAATGDLDIKQSMTIQGAAAATTIIDGNDTDRIFDIFNAPSLIISDLTIQNGYSGNFLGEDYYGGGILLRSGYDRLDIQFTDLIVQNNATAPVGAGGGIAAYGSATFTRVRFLNNTSDNSGGLHLVDGMSFEVLDSEFRGNSAEFAGGLGLEGNQSSLQISQSLFVDNTAFYGGGMVAFGTDAVVHISNTTFSNNLAYDFGGAYYADSVFSEFEYVTFTNNVSNADGGSGEGSAIVYASEEATAPALNFFATVIYGNTDGGGETAQCVDLSVNGGIITTEGYNLFGDMSGCVLTEAVAVASATDIYGQSPLLLALADNGGFTQTHALASNSPAVNAIPAGSCTLMTDQRGITRPDGAACDIGAYEGAVAIPTVPVPTNLTATATSYQAINLSWLDNASDETNYRVERSLDGNNWAEITSLTANAVVHSDTGLTCDTTYWYRVRAYRAVDTLYSAYSNSVSATTAPCAPVLSLGTVGQTSVQLTWADVLTETQYRIDRSPDGTNWTEIAQPVQNATSYTDTSVVCEGHYVYRIRAYRSTDGLFSEYSDPMPVDTLSCALTAPTGLSATASMDTAIMLQWNESNNSDTAHLLERRDDGINWVQIAELAPNSTAYTNTGLTCETTYEYRVRVYRSTDNAYSGYSNSITPMTALCPVPKTPTALQTTAIQARSVDLAWVDHNFGVMRYTVERSDNNGTSWQSYPVLANDVTTFNAYNLLCGHDYQFRVRGLRVVDSLLTDYSTTIHVQTAACPALVTPNAPTVTNFDRTFVTLSFTPDGSGEVDNWQLERLTAGNWQLLATLPVNTTQYTDNNLTCATGYSYRLRSYRVEDGALSAASTETPVTTASCPAIIQSTVGLYKNGLWLFTAVNASGVPDVMFNFGPAESGWTPLVGDWDGDGVDGIGVYRNGLFILRNSSSAGTTDAAFYFGAREAGWQPIVGDWNGDGVDTVGVYKAGLVMLTNNQTAQTVDYRFRMGDGTAGWIALAGDWDNNGADSVGLYRNGEFYLTNSLDGTGLRRPFRFGPASSEWTPLTGDWNADGTDTIGIYRQSVWRLRDTNSTGGVDTGFNFGAREAGWTPLASYRGGTVALAMLAQSAADAPVLTIPTETEVLITPPETVTDIPVTPEATAEVTEPVIPEATAEVTEPVIEVIPTAAPTESATPEPTPVPTDAPLEATESTPVTEVSSEQTPEVTETVGE